MAGVRDHQAAAEAHGAGDFDRSQRWPSMADAWPPVGRSRWPLTPAVEGSPSKSRNPARIRLCEPDQQVDRRRLAGLVPDVCPQRAPGASLRPSAAGQMPCSIATMTSHRRGFVTCGGESETVAYLQLRFLPVPVVSRRSRSVVLPTCPRVVQLPMLVLMTISPDEIVANAKHIVEACATAQVGDHHSMAEAEVISQIDELEDPNLLYAVVKVFSGVVSAFAMNLADDEPTAVEAIRIAVHNLQFRSDTGPDEPGP